MLTPSCQMPMFRTSPSACAGSPLESGQSLIQSEAHRKQTAQDQSPEKPLEPITLADNKLG